MYNQQGSLNAWLVRDIYAGVIQLAEIVDLKSIQCRFESDRRYQTDNVNDK